MTVLKLKKIIDDNQEKIDKEKSSYWKQRVKDFNFYDYREPMASGSFSPRTLKHLIYHHLNQRLYYNNINSFKVFNSEVYKNTLKIAKKQNRVLDYDFLRMVYTYNFLIEQKKLKHNRICIIGDGKANLTSIFLKMIKNIKIYYINLIESMTQDYQILKNSKLINSNNYVIVENIEDIKNNCKIYFIPIFNKKFIENSQIDLFINIASFQEMTPETLLDYFDLIQSNKSILYHCNRYSKKLDGGEIVKV